MKVALVGYGGIAAFHARALRQVDGVRLYTIIGRRGPPAEAFAAEWGFAGWGTELEPVLADPAVDAVVVASPSELHAVMAAACLRAGKPVLVEIPVAMSGPGARALASLARTTGVPLMAGHTLRFQSAQRFVREFLVSGRAGRIHQHQSYSFWLRHENVGWTGYRRSWVDDVVFHHGCHLVDFSLWCAASPVVRVQGELSPLDPRTGTSLDVSLLIRYASDAIATISLSYNARQAAGGERFICEGGVLELAGNTVRFGGEVVFTEEGAGGLEAGVLAQDREFVEAVRQGRAPACGPAEAVEALEVLQQVYDQAVARGDEERYRRRWEE
ncbi:MAG: Gfo/Idh/MocA family oxidoreductase [Candidatus Latescibacterota bacterium]